MRPNLSKLARQKKERVRRLIFENGFRPFPLLKAEEIENDYGGTSTGDFVQVDTFKGVVRVVKGQVIRQIKENDEMPVIEEKNYLLSTEPMLTDNLKFDYNSKVWVTSNTQVYRFFQREIFWYSELTDTKEQTVWKRK